MRSEKHIKEVAAKCLRTLAWPGWTLADYARAIRAMPEEKAECSPRTAKPKAVTSSTTSRVGQARQQRQSTGADHVSRT